MGRGSIGYTIDWEGDGVVDYATDAQGYLSGQTHTISKSCCSNVGIWTTIIRARTIGTSPHGGASRLRKLLLLVKSI